jgi:ribosomal protein L7/L12
MVFTIKKWNNFNIYLINQLKIKFPLIFYVFVNYFSRISDMAKLRLIDAGTNKIQIVKLVRIYSNLGLKESKEIVDQVPSEFFIDSENVDLQQVIRDFEKWGAKMDSVDDFVNETIIEKKAKKLYIRITMGSPEKIKLIKLIRDYSNISLKESNDLVGNIPCIFEVSKVENFIDIRPKFAEIGAWVEEVSEQELKQLEVLQKTVQNNLENPHTSKKTRSCWIN